MDVFNGLHIEPDDHESKLISKGIDFRKPATEHDLTSLSRNKLANRSPKAKSFLRWSYDWYLFDIILYYSIRPADINSNITLERLPITFQWETGSLLYQHISKVLTRLLSASRLSPIETPTDRSICHTFVALSDLWILTSSLGLSIDANEHNPLALLMSAIPYVCLWVYA
jgi:hypothetical protein